MNTGKTLIDDINACVVPHGHCAFWWIGQHSFIVKLGETILYIDPFLTDLPGRLIKPLLKTEELTNATALLCTHDHADHIDRDSMAAMLAASPKAQLLVPQRVRQNVIDDLKLDAKRVVGINSGGSWEIGNVKVTAVPAAHELLDQEAATGLHRYLGFVIEGNAFCLYHAGDTCIYEGMQTILRQWRFDLAFLPINGRDAKRLARDILGNMTYQEAADLAGSIEPGLTIPAHFEMFPGNTEDPQLFISYVRVKYPKLAAIIPIHGERTLVRSMAE